MEGRVQILNEGLFYLSCCQKIGNSNGTTVGERISCVQMALVGSGRMRGILGQFGKKGLCFPKSDYIYFPCCYYFFTKVITCIIFCVASVWFMLIISGLP